MRRWATYHTLQIYLVLFLGGALVALRASKPSVSDAILLGVLGGLAALAHAEYIALMAPLFLFRFWGRANFKFLLLSVAIPAACVPWTARNYVVLGRFTPVANATRFARFKGFNDLANGSGDWVDNNKVRETLLGPKLAAVPLDSSYETTLDDIMNTHALTFMQRQPLDAFVWLPLKKQTLFGSLIFMTPWLSFRLISWPFGPHLY